MVHFLRKTGKMRKLCETFYWGHLKNTSHKDLRNQNPSDGLNGYLFKVRHADQQNNEFAFRKFKPVTKNIDVKTYLTNFHVVDLT